VKTPAWHRWRAELAIVAVSFLWGATFVVVKSALADASTLVFLALRFALAAILLLGMFRLRSGSLGGFSKHWRGGLLCGFFLFVGYALQTAGLRTTAASKSAFLTGLFVVIVPVLSSALKRRAPRPIECAGALLAVGGTALLTVEPSADFRLSTGDLLTIGCAFAFSAHMLAVERFSSARAHQSLTLWQVLSVGAFSAAGCWWIETPRLAVTARLVSALLITALLATAVSFALYTWAQTRTTASRASLIFALEPVFAALTAWFWSREAWTFRTLAGGALILGAILLVEMKPSFEQTHPHRKMEA
jgi:drug/metabolite transporter (DMT)-like permease